jgi:hypothetical protein
VTPCPSLLFVPPPPKTNLRFFSLLLLHFGLLIFLHIVLAFCFLPGVRSFLYVPRVKGGQTEEINVASSCYSTPSWSAAISVSARNVKVEASKVTCKQVNDVQVLRHALRRTNKWRARCAGAHAAVCGVCTRVLSARPGLRRGTSYIEYDRATSWLCSGFMSGVDGCSIAVEWQLSIIGGLGWMVRLVEFLVHPGPNSELTTLQ